MQIPLLFASVFGVGFGIVASSPFPLNVDVGKEWRSGESSPGAGGGGGSKGGHGVSLLTDVPMHPAEMLGQVFFPGEASAAAPFAVGVRAHVAGFGAAMLPVDFPLVTEQAAGVGEAEDFLAAWFFADVWPSMFVSVFAKMRFSIVISNRRCPAKHHHIHGRDEKLTYIRIFSRTLEVHSHSLCEDTGKGPFR